MTLTLQQTTSQDRVSDVDTVSRIDPGTFLRDYIRPHRPLLMTGMMEDWPALGKWSFEFFRESKSQSTVHLEEGNVMQQETGFRKETFSDYITRLLDDRQTADGAYLSLFKIFDEFPHLRDDVDFSLLNQHKLKHTTVGWLGPAGTVTGYHIDWGDNILAQLQGRKSIHLASPAETPNMYVSRKFDQGTTISEVDLENVDQQLFPLFAKVKHQKIVLHPGQMLFIPRGWWHHVRALDKSISVSNIAYDARGILVDAGTQRLKQVLHNLGLWPCDCTCHVRRDGKWVRK